MNFDAGDSKGTISSGPYVDFYQPSQPGGGQSTATPLGRGCCWQLDTAHCERGSVIFRVLDPKSYARWPKLNSSKISSAPHTLSSWSARHNSSRQKIRLEQRHQFHLFHQHSRRNGKCRSVEDTGAEWIGFIAQSLATLILDHRSCAVARWQSLDEIMTLLELKQDPAEGPKVYSTFQEMVCMTNNSGKVTKRSWRQWRLKKILGRGFVNASVCKGFRTEMIRPQVISEFFVLYSLKAHGFEMVI